jgi:outer membrane immunogenic protein
MVRLRSIVGALVVLLFMGGTACAGGMMGTKGSSDYSGAYIGGYVGQSWVDLDYDDSWNPGYNLNADFEGFVGGLYLGYNYRIDNIMLGLEADAGLGDLSEGPDNDNSYNDWSAFEIDWDAHVRARVGVIYNTTLFYVAGGLALAKVAVDDTDQGYGGDNATHVGWTVGAGIEQKITEHLTARVEYLYDNYGNESYAIEDWWWGDTYPADVDLEIHTARIGLAYLF